MTTIYGFDSETFLIAPQRIAPPLVCASFWIRNESTNGGIVLGNGDVDLSSAIDTMFDTINDKSKDSIAVAHNAAFDLAVFCNHDPKRFVSVFKALEQGRVKDTIIREKLLNLTTTGDLQFRTNPDGSQSRIEYGLAPVIKHYNPGRDRTELKKDADAWRLNYHMLNNKKATEYPVEAYQYALDDAMDGVDIYQAQEVRREQIKQSRGFDPFATEDLHTATDFCLFLMTCRGVRINPNAVLAVQKELAEELSYDKLNLLVEKGILRPAMPGKPFKNGAKNPDGTPKMTKGSEESVNQNVLRAYVEDVAKANPEIEVQKSDKSEKFPEGQVSLKGEFFEDYEHLDPIFAQYAHRQKWQKIVSTELPRMLWFSCQESAQQKIRDAVAAVVHPAFDVLKETGRTSSYAAKENYPSFNCQNVDPRARKCYVPRNGMVLGSIDYTAMELATAAQRCLDLFDYSVLADKINAGIDVHAYLGARLAYTLNEGFRQACNEAKITNTDDIFAAFSSLEKQPEGSPPRDLYEHYRKFAKPTGLGYPGGLGAKTFVKFAKATYNVIVDVETAKMLREIWLETFPEFNDLFDFINKHSRDQFNTGRRKKKEIINNTDGTVTVVETEEEYGLYQYDTPMGLHRAGCDYCATCNGIALQSPSAEGAKLGLFLVTRACYDPSQSSILYGHMFPLMFIHDEIVPELTEDDFMHERMAEAGRLMREGMQVVTPRVVARTEGTLMRVWDKKAKAVKDSAGRLMIWTPKK